MGRPLRISPEHGWHHLYSRGIRRGAVFYDEHDCVAFLGILDEVFAEREISVFGYCLLGNHYHVGVSDRRGELSVGMHRVGTRYARHFNDRHGFDGPVFRSRYGSRLLTDDRDLVGVSRYIHRNSLDVDRLMPPSEYRWSSFGAYLGAPRALKVLVPDVVLRIAGGRSAYRALVEESDPLGAPVLRRRLAEKLDLRDIEHEVGRVFVNSSSVGTKGGRGRANDARSCVAFLLADVLGMAVGEIAYRYDYADLRSCARAMERYRTRLTKDPDLAACHEQTCVNLLLLSRHRAERAA